MIYSIKEILENESKKLWQGEGADIDLVQRSIISATEIITKQCEIGFYEGIEFPIQYMVDATHNFMEAISKRDDYLLADCLYFEWREIIIVFIELKESLEK